MSSSIGWIPVISLLPTLFALFKWMGFTMFTVENDSHAASKLMRKLGNTPRETQVVLRRDVSNGERTPTLVISLYPLIVAYSQRKSLGQSGGTTFKAYIYSFPGVFEALVADEVQCSTNSGGDGPPPPKNYVFSEYSKSLSKQYTYYNMRRTILNESMFKLDEGSPQMGIVEWILAVFKSKEKRNCSAFVYGPPGTGKSTISMILCLKLLQEDRTVMLCRFNPSRPGDDIGELLSMREDPDTVLVLLIDEVDVVLRRLRNGTVERNPIVATAAEDKKGWNDFMDFITGVPNVIVLMTSNTSKGQLDAEEVRGNGKERMARCLQQILMPFRLTRHPVSSNLRPGRLDFHVEFPSCAITPRVYDTRGIDGSGNVEGS